MRRMENFLENADRKIQRGLRSVQKAVKMVNIKSCFLFVFVFYYFKMNLFKYSLPRRKPLQWKSLLTLSRLRI